MCTLYFEEVAKQWLDDKKKYVRRSTHCAYALLLKNHLLTEFEQMGDLTESAVQEFVIRKMELGMSRRTVESMVMVLKMIVRYAVRNGWIKAEDMNVRFPIERSNRVVEVLTKDDQRSIMMYLRENFSFMNLGIYISLCAGLRIGEVCALTWDDMDTDAGVINVVRTIQRVYVVEESNKYTEIIVGPPKSRSSMRSVPVSGELMKIIRPLKKVVKGSCYVLTNDERPTEPRTYRNYYNRLMHKLDMPRIRFHGLRHSFATRCIESRCDYKTVSALMGHANISTTLNLYVHPDMAQKKRCVEQMLRALRV